jgi:hypothetical protein
MTYNFLKCIDNFEMTRAIVNTYIGQRSRSQLNFEFVRGLTARGYVTLCVALVYYLFSIGARSLLVLLEFQVWLKSIEPC